MPPPPRPVPETPTARRLRQLDYFRRAADAAMRAVDIASEQLEAAHAAGEPAATVAPNLELGRAIRGLVLAVNAENRVVKGEAPRRAPASDTRRDLLREALYGPVRKDPNPARRAEGYREIDERVEEALLADPESEIPIKEHLISLADELHIRIEWSKVSDAVLGMPPRTYLPDREPEYPEDYDPDNPRPYFVTPDTVTLPLSEILRRRAENAARDTS